jgi:hypothetical protein
MANLLRCRVKSGLIRSSFGADRRLGHAGQGVGESASGLACRVTRDMTKGPHPFANNAAASDTSFEHRSGRKVRSVATGWIRT